MENNLGISTSNSAKPILSEDMDAENILRYESADSQFGKLLNSYYV